METSTEGVAIDPQVLQAAQCEHGFACLGEESPCETMRFTNKDVEIVKCLGKLPCAKRNSYDGMQICTCPVQRELHGLQA